MNAEKLDIWAVVELFGHSQIAGRCTEQNVAGTNMLRIDVPETDRSPGFTRLLNHAAIYAINPVTEEVARFKASALEKKPIEAWDIREFIQKKSQAALNAPAAPEEEEEQDDGERSYTNDRDWS